MDESLFCKSRAVILKVPICATTSVGPTWAETKTAATGTIAHNEKNTAANFRILDFLLFKIRFP
jgi:hypothetical protein